MPTSSTCFSNPADLPPGTGNRDAVQSVQCGLLHCFSYPADVPPGPRRMHTGTTCFGYPGDVPPGRAGCIRLAHCFRYPADRARRDHPAGINLTSSTRSREMPAQSGLLDCFSYLADVPLGDSVEPDLGDPRTMPIMCFRY